MCGKRGLLSMIVMIMNMVRFNLKKVNYGVWVVVGMDAGGGLGPAATLN